MNEPLLVAFYGKRRSGKNLSAFYIKKSFSNVEIDSFAAPIKSLICQLLGISLRELEKNKEKIYPQFLLSPRQMLQKIGTDLLREQFDREVWTKALENRFLKSKKDIFVISDLRFPNEYDLIKKYSGFVIKVERVFKRSSNIDQHSSEIQNLKYDFVVRNNYSKKYLKEEVVNILNYLIKGKTDWKPSTLF